MSARTATIALTIVAVTYGVSGFSRTVVAAQQPPSPAPSPRAQAPVDLTGYWISIVTEDWRWRMVTPPKGDYSSVPLTAAARKVADAWDPARDTTAGEACRAYGAAAIMRVPGRVRISWENDTTLRVDTEAGTQARLFRFIPSATGGAGGDAAPAAPAGAPSWQGRSVAQWQAAGGRRGAPPTGGSLRVMTTGMRPGYLRKNGVPYSANAVVTEHYNRTNEPNGDGWLIVTTIVEDPLYLTARFVTSTHFKKAADGSIWNPTPCEAS
ncbi:MAG: hypothetical protein EXQ53_06520 [Acidobacteria bacterium]|nr:hypothetical protein [Acidobacteriota bacterium]